MQKVRTGKQRRGSELLPEMGFPPLFFVPARSQQWLINVKTPNTRSDGKTQLSLMFIVLTLLICGTLPPPPPPHPSLFAFHSRTLIIRLNGPPTPPPFHDPTLHN